MPESRRCRWDIYTAPEPPTGGEIEFDNSEVELPREGCLELKIELDGSVHCGDYECRCIKYLVETKTEPAPFRHLKGAYTNRVWMLCDGVNTMELVVSRCFALSCTVLYTQSQS